MAEQPARDRILGALQELPAEATYDDAIERLVFMAKIDEGLTELDAGKGVAPAVDSRTSPSGKAECATIGYAQKGPAPHRHRRAGRVDRGCGILYCLRSAEQKRQRLLVRFAPVIREAAREKGEKRLNPFVCKHLLGKRGNSCGDARQHWVSGDFSAFLHSTFWPMAGHRRKGGRKHARTKGFSGQR